MALQMRIGADRSVVDAYRFDLVKQIERSRKVIELARSSQDLRAETTASLAVANACWRTGSTDEGLENCRRSLKGAERLRDRPSIGIALKLSVMFFNELAMWDEAKVSWDRLAEMSDTSGYTIARRALAEAEQGNEDEAQQLFQRTIKVDESGDAATYVAVYLIRSGDRSILESAKAQLRMTKKHSGQHPPRAAEMRGHIARTAAMTAYFEHDQKAAEKVFDSLQSVPEFPGAANNLDRFCGFLDLTLGKLNEAIEHFDRSIAKCRESRFVVLEGWDRFFRAETLLRRNDQDDRGLAVEDLSDLVGHCGLYGLVLLEGRTKALMASVSDGQNLGSARRVQPDGLTNREVEVLGLVARGLRNKQIAAELFISSKTAANHIRNILEKTGAANRAEAAVYAVKHRIA